jgi:hypothetical protein
MIHTSWFLFGLAMISATAAATSAQTDGDNPSTSSPVAAPSTGCRPQDPRGARLLADKAFETGAYQEAGRCYLIAGEQALADRAFMRAVGPASAATAPRLTANRESVAAQVVRWKELGRNLQR